MKALTLTISILLTLTQTSFAGGWASGGGDPKEVEAKVFPYMEKIKAAVQLLKENLDKTSFNDNFKKAFKKDMDALLKKKYFFYVPELFAVGFNRHPGDYKKLFSNGAMTGFEPASPIYFSKQAIEYDVRTLARVIGQEIPHHIFTGRFQKNEEFANNLGTYLVLLDEVPMKPYNAAHIIIEEFGQELNNKFSKEKIAKAREDFAAGEDVLHILYNLSHDLYKIRGTWFWHHVEFAYLKKADLFASYPKTSEVTALKKLQIEKIGKCMFATYEDGAGGVTEAYQKLLAETFYKLLQEFKSKIKAVYYTEDFYLPAAKVLTDCGFGVEDKNGQMMIFKSIYRHEGRQCGQPGNPCDIPPLND